MLVAGRGKGSGRFDTTARECVCALVGISPCLALTVTRRLLLTLGTSLLGVGYIYNDCCFPWLGGWKVGKYLEKGVRLHLP